MQLNTKDRNKKDVLGQVIVGFIYCRCYHEGGGHSIGLQAGIKALGDDRWAELSETGN